MKRYRIVAILLLIFSLIGIIFLKLCPVLVLNKIPPTTTHEQLSSGKDLHPSLFFDQDSFYSGAAQSTKNNQAFTSNIKGGIIPHHLLPGYLTADFFHRLSFQNPQTIILIGPNHYEKGDYNSLTCRKGWQTPFGQIEINGYLVEKIVNTPLFYIDETVFDNEHSIGGIVPYIKFYLPQAALVPVIFKKNMTEAEINIIANTLSEVISPSTVILASVDFSHNLTSPQAQQKDQETERALLTFDYQKLLSFTNDHLDSPPAIVTLLKVMQKVGSINLEILYHTNSGEITNNPYSSTTSYYWATYF